MNLKNKKGVKMKILIAIMMMFLIVSCESTNDEDLEKRVDYLESKLFEMDKELEMLSLQVGRNSDSLLWD